MITVKNGLAVQSFHYRVYLPIGSPVHLAENLNRWGVDEILVLDICRSKLGIGPNLDLLKAISSSHVNTPLIYGGGIHSVEEAIAVVHSGADRVVLDSVLHRYPDTVSKISKHLGAQAVIASFPLSLQENGSMLWYDHVAGLDVTFRKEVLDVLRPDCVSEILLIDRDHDGVPGTFEIKLLELFPVKLPSIVFGGLSVGQDLEMVLEHPLVAATAIGNTLNYSEHSVQRIKSRMTEQLIRKAHYSNDYR